MAKHGCLKSLNSLSLIPTSLRIQASLPSTIGSFLTDPVLRAVIDAGYEGGTVDRVNGDFPVHFPCIIAMRGQIHDVPL
jgi:hypothetical protein